MQLLTKRNKLSDQTIKFQANIYVYDLHNCARKFGFKADEIGQPVWRLNTKKKS